MCVRIISVCVKKYQRPLVAAMPTQLGDKPMEIQYACQVQPFLLLGLQDHDNLQMLGVFSHE
jgi:hypothetical protein